MDSLNWTFFPFDSQNWTLLSNMTCKKLNPSFQHDSKNWTLFLTCLIIFFAKNIQRIEPSFEYDSKNWTFSNMTPRKWTFFWTWFTEMNLFFSITQRMEHLRVWLKELDIFWFDSKNWTFCFTWFQEQNFFYPRIWTFFFKFESKNWFFQKISLQIIDPFFEYDSQNWTLLTRLKDLRTFLHESKNSNTFLK